MMDEGWIRRFLVYGSANGAHVTIEVGKRSAVPSKCTSRIGSNNQ